MKHEKGGRESQQRVRPGLQSILSRAVTESLIGKVAFEQRPVEIWGISGRGKDNYKSVKTWRV